MRIYFYKCYLFLKGLLSDLPFIKLAVLLLLLLKIFDLEPNYLEILFFLFPFDDLFLGITIVSLSTYIIIQLYIYHVKIGKRNIKF